MINTSKVENNNKQYISKYLEVGKHEVKINNITAFQANSGSYQLRFELETHPITIEGFTPAEGYTGQIGTVRTVYLANEAMEQQVGQMIANLADSLGVREQVNALSQDLTYPEYCQQLTDIVKGKYVWVSISGKKYVNSKTGKVGTELQFSRFKTFASLQDVAEKGEDKVLAKPYVKELPQTESPKEEVLF